MPILKMTGRNDVHLPAKLVRSLNLGEEKFFFAVVKGSSIILTPVDIEPRYSKEALDGLERLVKKEKGRATQIRSRKDIEGLFE